MSYRSKTIIYCGLLIFLSLIVLIVLITKIPPFAQSLQYHQFADTRTRFEIPHFGDVISNLLFCLVGIIGFFSLRKSYLSKKLTRSELFIFIIMLGGIFFTGIGSTYYHWQPNNQTLVWDRLPMTIVFMSLLAFTIMERIHLAIGFWLLFPLIFLGLWSVWYWQWTETLGQGDLRFYFYVQFYSIFLIFAILFLFPKRYPPLKAYLWMLFFYAIAKLAEIDDITIFEFGKVISGHTLKHIAAAISSFGIVMMIDKKNSS